MFSAGVVSATLEGNFRPAGFMAFNSAVTKSEVAMKKFEASAEASSARVSAATGKMGSEALAASGLWQDAEGRWRSASGRFASDAEKAAAGVEKSSGRMGKAFATAGKVAAGGLLVIGLGLVKAAKEAIDFEKSMRNVNSIAGLGEGKFKALSKSVLELSGKTAQAPKTLAEGLYQLVSSGFDAQDSLVILKSSAKAATAGLTDTETATTAVAAALNSYHLSAKDAADVSDILFQTVNRGVISFPELAQTIGTVLPFASSLHIGLNQVGASISTLTKEGIPAAEATTYLKNAMVQFLKPSDALAAAIKKTGFESGEALVKSKGFQGALDAVAKTSDGTKGALQTMFPDIRASAAVFALTGKNAKTAADDLRNFSAAATAGATEKVFKEQSKSVAFQMQQLKANLSVLGIEIGTALLPTINNVVTAASKFIAEINAGKGAGADFVSGLKHGFADLLGVITTVGEAVLWVSKGLNAAGLANIDTAQMQRGLNSLNDFRRDLTRNPIKVKVGVSADISAAQKALRQIAGGGAGITKATLKILADDGPAKEKIAALEKLGISPKVAKILADVSPALKGVSTTKEALDRLHDKVVNVKANAESARIALRNLQGESIRTKVLAIVGKDISATAKIKAIQALGIPAKTARILANGSNALNQIAAVRNQLLGLQDRTIHITAVHSNVGVSASGNVGGSKTITKKASGRGPGGSETALVGEGQGGELVGNPIDGWSWVTGPTLMDLSPRDAVVPEDPRYAGRALGMMFAAMGVPGYAKGKKPKLAVPDAVRYGGVSEDSILSARDNAREDYQKRKGNVHDLDVKIREQEKKVGSTKGKAHDTARAKLRDLKKDRAHYSGGGGGLHSLSWMRQHYEDLAKQAQVLHATNLEIDRLDKVQSTDRTKMETASKRGDAGAWGTAKKDRDGILSKLKSAYKQALKYAKPGSNFAADLEGKLADIDSQIADAGSDAFAGPDRSDGMTDAERATYGALQAQQSLAALTAGLGDDQAAAQRIEGFLSGVLGEVLADPANRGGSAAVSSVADALKQARDNVASFSSSGGSQNADADLQAQLDQQRTRADVAERNAQIAERGLSVFQGAGDIGQGPSITINTLHPGDPRTLAAVGDAAAAGFSQQPYRTSPRTNLGL